MMLLKRVKDSSDSKAFVGSLSLESSCKVFHVTNFK